MHSTPYFTCEDADPDGQSTKAELLGLLGALIVLKTVFAGAILLYGTERFTDLSSVAGQLAMHWMLVTAVLVAVPVALIWHVRDDEA
jgi:hypothetical protein